MKIKKWREKTKAIIAIILGLLLWGIILSCFRAHYKNVQLQLDHISGNNETNDYEDMDLPEAKIDLAEISGEKIYYSKKPITVVLDKKQTKPTTSIQQKCLPAAYEDLWNSLNENTEQIPQVGGSFSSRLEVSLLNISTTIQASVDTPDPGGAFSSSVEKDNSSDINLDVFKTHAPPPGGVFISTVEKELAPTEPKTQVTDKRKTSKSSNSKDRLDVKADTKSKPVKKKYKKLFRIKTIGNEVYIARALIKEERFVTMFLLDGKTFREAKVNITSITPFVPDK